MVLKCKKKKEKKNTKGDLGKVRLPVLAKEMVLKESKSDTEMGRGKHKQKL